MRLRDLGRRLFGHGRADMQHSIVLYGKPGCHLCDDARALLKRLGRHHNIMVEEIDITSDPALFRTYDIRIPVMLIDSRHEIEAPINEADILRALA